VPKDFVKLPSGLYRNTKTGRLVSAKNVPSTVKKISKSASKPVAKSKPKVSKKLLDFESLGQKLVPIDKQKFRDIQIPIHYKKGVVDQDRLVKEWEAVIRGLSKGYFMFKGKRTKKVFATSTLLVYRFGAYGEISAYNLIPGRAFPTPQDLIGGLAFTVDKYKFRLLDDAKFLYLIVHAIFDGRYIDKLRG